MLTTTTPSITVGRTGVTQLWREGEEQGLFRMHHAEMGTGVSLDLDVEPFYRLQEEGDFLGLGAWLGDKLVGYCINTMSLHGFYNERWCNHIAMFVHPDYRRGNVGRRMLQAVEQMAFKDGCVRITMHAKPNTAMEMILPRSGYKPLETVFIKELDHG